MGALHGTLTYKLFYVQGDLPEDWKDVFLQRIRKNAFVPLSPEDEDEISDGWVPIGRPLHQEFDLFTFLFDHFINLGFRQDKYALPAALLKAHIDEAEREFLIKNGRERLSKFEREDIKAMVKKRIKERQLPRMKVIDMSWDMRASVVRFWSQSNTSCEVFQGYFEDTFGLKIVPANPYINALQVDLSNDQVEQLAVVEPSSFVDVISGSL